MIHYRLVKYSSVILGFILYACVKDKPNPVTKTNVVLSSNEKVFVINEGPFNTGNGSVSLYDPISNNVVEDVFYEQNAQKLGNIVQSMSVVNGQYCIVVNNSNKIVFCNKDFKKTAQIIGFNSPRYVLPVSNKKGYVTDLYANAISIVDFNSLSKTGSIPCKGKTEKIISLYNKAFVTNTDKEYVYIINTITDQITDSVNVGLNAYGIEADKNDDIWVLSNGKKSAGISGRLTRFDALTHTIKTSFSFSSQDSPGHLQINKTKDSLYYINNHVYRLSINDGVLPSSAFIINDGRNFYGMGIHPRNHSVYLADAMDYSQKSTIYVHDASGKLKTSFKTAICANSFWFE